MSEPLSTDPYKGVRDFYPADWARETLVFDRLRHILGLHGYEEYNASPLERAELYEAKTSEEIVGEQTYTFIDRGDRRVTLRPEMTPTLARMVAAKRRELALPLRWFNIGNRFRYERPQRGRLREFYQLDVDLIGIKEETADEEVVTIAYELLKGLGAKNDDFIIRVNSRALLDAACRAVTLTEDQKRAYLRLLDRKSKMSKEEYDAARTAITAHDPLDRIERGAGDVAKEMEKLARLIESLIARGMTNVLFDPNIVRGFDYYTGIVFEVFDTNMANPRAIFGGGRYDNLIAAFGGDPIPAIGFGMGDVTLMDFLETHGLVPETTLGPQVYLGTPQEDDLAGAHAFAQALRAKNIRVFVNLTRKSLGDQVKDALRRGIPYFVAVGADERASGVVRVKRLSTSEEISTSIEKLADIVRTA